MPPSDLISGHSTGTNLGHSQPQLSLAGLASDDRTICMHAEFSHPCRIQM